MAKSTPYSISGPKATDPRLRLPGPHIKHNEIQPNPPTAARSGPPTQILRLATDLIHL